MKHISSFLTLLFGIILLSGNTTFAHLKSRYRTVLTCKMANGDKVILKDLEPVGDYPYLEIDGKEYLADGDKPYFEINGKTSLVFDKDDTYGIVTELVVKQCIQHTLVVTMSTGSPYPRGLAIRVNPITHQYESIYFAEKEAPSWLYFKNNEWGVIISNIGNETRKKYLVYTYKSGKNQPERQDNMTPMDNLPAPRKNLAHIRLPKNLG